MRPKPPPKPQRPPPASEACRPDPVHWPVPAGDSRTTTVAADMSTVRSRVSRLTHTLETDVIPRLVRQHRDVGPGAPAAESTEPADVPALQGAELQAFVDALIAEDDERTDRVIQALRQRGVPVGAVYVDLLAPAARQLGVMWEEDRVDFATATVSLGRLQRLMRQLSPDFGREVEHPYHGRRVLLTQPESEQHMFGLSMVAEFFRRDGWDVLGGVAGVGIEPVAWVRRDWFDVIGFSIGSETNLAWLRDTIAAVRSASRNPVLVVLVGGPLFSTHPAWVAEVGADATADGRTAPGLAEALVSQRVQEQSGAARIT
jgi:MerR family transcriptional regulator, light-induced transcriptional regulator